ncbi:zinc-finger domain-containing protein [Collimonas humicola]|uniref:zinc-finger domain-containing protein n=1 Tax=Collimonas humicola TaxID=2825886 RepID=UPI001B8C258B|nr:zinc-finger domain-containing protein [Collimonas humicola]
MNTATSQQAVVELDGKDLPAHCPNPLMPTWSSHPRVFLNLDSSGSAKCPYCGTQYRLKPGAVVTGH